MSARAAERDRAEAGNLAGLGVAHLTSAKRREVDLQANERPRVAGSGPRPRHELDERVGAVALGRLGGAESSCLVEDPVGNGVDRREQPPAGIEGEPPGEAQCPVVVHEVAKVAASMHPAMPSLVRLGASFGPPPAGAVPAQPAEVSVARHVQQLGL